MPGVAYGATGPTGARRSHAPRLSKESATRAGMAAGLLAGSG